MNIEIHNAYGHTSNFLNMESIVKTDTEKAHKVYSSIKEKLGYDILNSVYNLYLYDTDESFTLAFKFLKLMFRHGASFVLAKNNETIYMTDKLCRRVTLEAHRFKGFVRFKEIGHLTFYSRITPDHNILPLIASHFKKRFSDQSFIIHDYNRECAIVYNKEDLIIIPMTKETGDKLSNCAKDEAYDRLWKAFYRSTDIPERMRLKQQRGYMPKRYWINLNELA